jgi:hypothetical protein
MRNRIFSLSFIAFGVLGQECFAEGFLWDDLSWVSNPKSDSVTFVSILKKPLFLDLKSKNCFFEISSDVCRQLIRTKDSKPETQLSLEIKKADVQKKLDSELGYLEVRVCKKEKPPKAICEIQRYQLKRQDTHYEFVRVGRDSGA